MGVALPRPGRGTLARVGTRMLRQLAICSTWLVAACSSTYLGDGDGAGIGAGSGGTVGPSGPTVPRAGRDGTITMPPGTAGRSQPGTGGRGGGGGGQIVVPPDGSAIALAVSVRARGVLVLSTRSTQPLYIQTCSNAIVLEKDSAGTWVGLRDDRPPSSNNPGYLLDGQYVSPSRDLGCELVSCRPLAPEEPAGSAIEYVTTGSGLPPGDADVPTEPVANIESRGVRGEMRLRFSYFADSACTRTRSVDVYFDMPEGFCCLRGPGGCNPSGPIGGWAPTEATCPSDMPALDASYEQRLDPWGCPVLAYDASVCCNCVPEDAGIEDQQQGR